MWGKGRLGEGATAASMAAKVGACVESEIRGTVLQADYSEWDELLTANDDATAEYIRSAKPAAASLLRLRALSELDSVVVMARGPAYPFVFGTKKTNGLVSALQFALDNAGLALYTDGASRRTCMGVVPRHSKLSDLFWLLDDLDGVALERDASVRYPTYVRLLGRAKVAGLSSALQADCGRLARLGYHEAFVAGAGVSAELTASTLATCRTGVASSRVGQLVLKKIDLDTAKVVDALEAERGGCDEASEREDVHRRLHVALSKLNSNATLGFR
jgi:hypothetical protein